jgi:Mor family transcriptional regulator
MSMADLFPDEQIPDDVLDHLDDPEVRSRWPRDLAAMLDVLEAELGRHVDDETQARRLAAVAITALAEYHGGRMFYLPKGDGLALAIRDRQMWETYRCNRDDVQRLAAEHGLTEQQVYAILRRQRAIYRRRIQPDLLSD